jgi:secreted trypsin-like serine protease
MPARNRLRPAVVAGVGAGLLLVLAALAPALASAARVRPRIVNGASTPIEQAPFQVALYDPQAVDPGEPQNLREAQFCGGVIRDATHVITAAHCVTLGGFEAAPPGDIAVLAGTNNTEAPGAQAVEDPVLATSYDPDWNPGTGERDLGVLTLANPLWPEGATPEIDGTSTIAPIKFAAAGEVVEGAEATVSGWGLTRELEPEQELDEEEEREAHPAVLQSGKVSLVSHGECSDDYEAQGLEAIGEGLLCAIGSSPSIADACYGDSGGPLFSGAPGTPEDRLLGTVAFGAGCAQPEFPGVYQSLVDPVNVAFAGSNPPQAPIAESRPTITGTAQPGQTVACSPGVWLGAPEFLYRFFRDESTFSHPGTATPLTSGFSSSAAYAVVASDVGTRIFCEVLARNAGGVGSAIGTDVTVSPAPLTAAPAAPAPPAAPVSRPAPLLAPTLRVLSKTCRRTSCTVSVRASQGVGAAAVKGVEARLTFSRRVSCRRRGKRTTCRRTFRRRLAATAMPGGRFVIHATGLKPGAYTLTMTAVDTVGIRQTHPTILALAPKPARRRR